MTRMRGLVVAAVGAVALLTGISLAQRQPSRNLQLPSDRAGVANWENDKAFPKDVFTFVRIEYDSYGGRGRWGGRWTTDWPDAELNLSFRLQQLTSLKVNPEPVTLRLTDPKLFDYPFIYIVEPGMLSFGDDEVLALRKYLLNGGFLMVDDFWGEREWKNFADEMKRVFPAEPKSNVTAVGVTWLSGFQYEIKVVARIPTSA